MGKAVVSVVLVAFVASLLAWSLDLIGPWYRYLSSDRGAGATSPTKIAPPSGLRLTALAPAAPVARPVAGTTGVDPAKVRAALAPYLADADLGTHVVAAVADLSASPSAGPIVSVGHGAATPASTTKLLTSTAALAALGPETTFATTVVSAGHGRIVLVGGGDPLLASKPVGPASTAIPAYPHQADLQTLATETAADLTAHGRSRVRLGYDDSLFTGPSTDPAWPASYTTSGVVAPISALWVDEGRPASGVGRVADPSAYAAQDFAADLAASGITVVGAVTHGPAPAGGRTVAQVHSPPLREIVEHTLLISDNEAAEVLAHQVGLEVEGAGSFAAGVQGVLATLARLGVPTGDIVIHDGSGLSRQDSIPPAALIAVLQAAFDPRHPELGAVADGLPVSGFSGSLADRFGVVFPDARGLVRAKIGTLSGVSALAGIAVDQQGHAMLFALMADQIDPIDETKAENALDVAAGSLAACACGSGNLN